MKRTRVTLLIVAICMLAATAASAQSNVAVRGVGFKVGLIDPEHIDTTVGLALILDMGTIAENWALESYSGLWWKSEGAFGTKVSMRDLAFGARTKYMFEINNPGIRPFLGAGLGLHILTASVEMAPIIFQGDIVTPGFTADNTELHLGLDLGGGFLFDSGNNWAFATELWHTTVSDANHFAWTIAFIKKLSVN